MQQANGPGSGSKFSLPGFKTDLYRVLKFEIGPGPSYTVPGLDPPDLNLGLRLDTWAFCLALLPSGPLCFTQWKFPLSCFALPFPMSSHILFLFCFALCLLLFFVSLLIIVIRHLHPCDV